MQHFKSFSINVLIVDEDLLRVFYRLLYLQFCDLSDQRKYTVLQQKIYLQFEKYFYMKIIVTIILTSLFTNSLLSSFCPFLQTKNKNQVFSKLMVW